MPGDQRDWSLPMFWPQSSTWSLSIPGAAAAMLTTTISATADSSPVIALPVIGLLRGNTVPTRCSPYNAARGSAQSADRTHLAGRRDPDGERRQHGAGDRDPERRRVAAGDVVQRAGHPRTGGAAADGGQHERAEDRAVVTALEDLGGNRADY